MKDNNWYLLDYCRVDAGQGLVTPSIINSKARFAVIYSKKTPLEYYKGPFSKRDAEHNKAYIEKIWDSSL